MAVLSACYLSGKHFLIKKVSGIHYVNVALFQVLVLSFSPIQFSKILAFVFECHYI